MVAEKIVTNEMGRLEFLEMVRASAADDAWLVASGTVDRAPGVPPELAVRFARGVRASMPDEDQKKYNMLFPAWIWLLAEIAFLVAKHCFVHRKERVVSQLADLPNMRRRVAQRLASDKKLCRTEIPFDVRCHLVELALERVREVDGGADMVAAIRSSGA